jgi:hypothetical protein
MQKEERAMWSTVTTGFPATANPLAARLKSFDIF